MGEALARHACGDSDATPAPHWRFSGDAPLVLPGVRLSNCQRSTRCDAEGSPHPLRATTRGPVESLDATLRRASRNAATISTGHNVHTIARARQETP